MDTIQHIRNATMKIRYAGSTFLIDPMLSSRGTYPGFPGTVNSHFRNPLVDLPVSLSTILDGVDACIVTHTHLDHWDDGAQKYLPKDLPVFTQHEADAELIRKQGFTNVRVLVDIFMFSGVSLYKTGGKHGSCEMFENEQIAGFLGSVMGVVLQASGHPTVYIVGDTVWESNVDAACAKYHPDYMILNAGYAKLEGFEGSVIMGKEDVSKACEVRGPHMKVLAVHIDALNHCVLSRQELRQYIEDKQLVGRASVPDDGEVITL